MRTRIVCVAAALSLLTGIAHAPASAATQEWAPFDRATIHPGVQTITAGLSQCTSNFVFQDGTDVYLGQAAHCSIAGSSLAAGDPLSESGPDGCATESQPLGTEVLVGGASRPATLVYNSWITMQQVGEKDPNACSYNDFALVKLDPADHSRVNPTMPHWGGPNGITTSTNPGDKVVSYGSSELRFALTMLSPKQGISRGQTAGGWNHTVLTLTPGIPGDSGSGFIDGQGRAFGVLSTLLLLPQPAHNGVCDLSRALEYMRAHTELDGVVLVNGTEPFEPDSPLDLPLTLLNPALNVVDQAVGLLGRLGL